MAIFTNQRDRESVPHLVQLAQIDVDNDDEVIHALDLVIGGNTDHSGLWGHIPPKDIRALEMVISILRDLGAHSAMRADCAVWLNRHSHLPEYEWELSSEAAKREGYKYLHNLGDSLIALSDMEYESPILTPTLPFAETVASMLHPVVMEAWQAVKINGDASTVVALCPECDNPMLRPRENHFFCSRRCADRAGQRKRRQEKQKSHDI